MDADTSREVNFNPRSLAGATAYPVFAHVTAIANFNPRSLAGATGICSLIIRLIKFQSTLPRGSDEQQHDERRDCQQFQSTLPRGSDD